MTKTLMYHGITHSKAAPLAREEGAHLYDVPVENFINQLEWLKRKNFTFTTNPGEDHPFSIVITLDDGEKNNITTAFPVLQKLQIKAYFFIIVKRIGKNGYMNWEDLSELAKNGMIIGSHGLTHEILTDFTEIQIKEELRASKATLENNLGINIDCLSIPRGFCNDKILQIAQKTGYSKVFISRKEKDITEPCYERIAIKKNWNIQRFAIAVNGQTTFLEQLKIFFKGICILFLRERNYNFLRNLLIRLLK